MATAARNQLRTIAVILAVLALIMGAPGLAFADPPDDEDGSSTLTTLRSNLAAAAEAYLKAESELTASKAKQATAEQQLTAAEAEVIRVRSRVADFAAESYRHGRIRPVALMLQSSNTADFIGRAQMLDAISRDDRDRLVQLADAKQRAAAAKATIDAEVANQAAAVKEMALRKQAAERSLASAAATRANVDTSTAPTARPAPRNSDGSWPGDPCDEDDPTTSGCITSRTLHAYSETKRVGFDLYVSCFRPGNKYEHPKGRACDWSTFPRTFVNRSATGEAKAYGDRLAAFYVKNARALGVMYVVWYCQIWQVSVGWHRYNSAGANCGDQPAPDHTNHVHLSVY